MHIYKVKYFVFGDPVVAIVRAESEGEAEQIIKDRNAKWENQVSIGRVYQYEDNVKDILLSYFP